MNNNTQSRPGTKVLVSLAIALSVSIGVVGCVVHPTTPTGSSTISTTAPSQPLVDVERVWQSEPLPDCPKPPVIFNGAVPPGLSLPDKASVARQLAGVKSPASEGWVRTKLGWVTQWLAQTRAGIIDHPDSPAVKANIAGFNSYVKHVGSELTAGHDIQDSIYETYPEGCM
ncbi:hypothetical protein I3U46_08390 [Mycobacteroides abscessus subsp. massiliense]|uniref:hypothetical protein n=1 Tax=Mycobacteroides abscessus TaxID=36809 RepID=UPI0019D05843|nr:hypothetical protein [Mycobacteroides abscessus]MBN7524323.1 hypothetical protein [Mycobacteroides abscessus subsp. massiliense]